MRSHGHSRSPAARRVRIALNPEGIAVEHVLADRPGPFCFGPAPTPADLCLVPQLFNAHRFGCDPEGLPRPVAAETACNAVPAFAQAAPDRQIDAE